MRLLSALLLGLLLYTAPVAALDEQQYQQARQAFSAGDFQRALGLFEQLQHANPDNDNLLYNVGVCAFKLQNYDKASEVFRRLLQSVRYSTLARLNLGLIENKQNNIELAKEHFLLLLKQKDDVAVARMAQLLLERMGVDVSDHTTLGINPFNIYVSLAAGQESGQQYDFTLGSETPISADQFSDTLLYSSYSYELDRNSLLQFKLDAFQRFYRVYDENNIGLLGGAVLLQLQSENWQNSVEFRSSHLRWQQDAFYQQSGVQLRFYQRAVDQKWRLKLFGYYIHSLNYLADYLQGFNAGMDLDYRHYPGKWPLRIKYRFKGSVDARENLSLNGNYYSYSPARAQLELEVSYKFPDSDWSVEATGGLRGGVYLTEHVIDGLQRRRIDVEPRFGTLLKHQWNTSLAFWLGLDSYWRRSNIERYDYGRNALSLNLEWFYF